MKQMKVFVLTVLMTCVGSLGVLADENYSLRTSITWETVDKQVSFTYKTTTKTLDVVRHYELEAVQGVNRNYDHAVLPIPYSELSEALGVTVTASNVGDMIYYPLADGGYGHNNDNWFDSNGYRSSWSGQSYWFIQHITTDTANFIFWTGQAGQYNSQYGANGGEVYTSTFYMVNGTTAIELTLTLSVVSGAPEVPEWVRVYDTPSLSNIRDLGGWQTERGETVRYGLLFRGCELNGDKYNADAQAKAMLKNELGIRAELDLRKHTEAKAISASVLGSDVDYLRVVNEPHYVEGARTAFQNYRNNFEFILKSLRSNKPVYFHCIWGADRTGTLAFLLEGLLGLSEEDLYYEYELTLHSNIDGVLRSRTWLVPLMQYICSFDGATLQEKFINYWHQRVRIPLGDLNEFCQIMLGTETDYVAGIVEPMENLAYNVNGMEASFTHSTTNLYTINDGVLGFGELAESKHWNTWDANRPAEQWLRYQWADLQRAERVRVAFWTDTDTPGDHVAVPASWKVQYRDETSSTWKDVTLLEGEAYTQSRTEVSSVRFEPVETTGLRLVMQCQKGSSTYSAVGVTEWEVLGEPVNGELTISDYPIQNVDFSKVDLTDTFWRPRMEQNQSVTIPFAIQQCYDSRRVLNFQKAAAILRGENIGYFDTECTFDDTDIYKILEGMAYSVQVQPNAEISAKMDELIASVGAAQEPDGYLYTARTAGKPGSYHSWVGDNRWEKDPDLSHELYNAGHLYEAAYAHYISTGKTTLLDIALKNADLLVKDFLYGGLTYEPGHQIVEMGLVKLYRATGKEDYLKLAKYFLDLRGARGTMRQEYSQTHKPVLMQDEAVGHAVRAAYMYSGMADVAALMHNDDYLAAIDRIWSNVTEKKYYINGGIGARHNGEAFGSNYELPNKEAYCETCAAIANVYWNWRMFLLHGESKYYDVLERSLYNGVISGINLAGNRFFYPNPLASDGDYERQAWFGCACCPSNLCRFIASVPGYIYAHKDDKVYVNLYVQGSADIDLGEAGTLKLTQQTDYPWDGDIQLTINNEQLTNSHFTLMLRKPGWANDQPVPSDLYSYINTDVVLPGIFPVIKVNGEEVDYTMQDGYMMIEREWAQGDIVTFTLPMPVQHVLANDAVTADRGLVAIERGPILYCMEGIDNDNYDTLIANDEATATIADSNINGYTFQAIDLAGQVKLGETTQSATLRLIPYYAWNNRGLSTMKVWIPRTAETIPYVDWPVIVKMANIDVVGDFTHVIDSEPLNDNWAMHNLSGLSARCDVPTTLDTPISNFHLNMVYAPTDDSTLNRTKNASDSKGFWYELHDGTPETAEADVPLYNQPTWNSDPARIYLNIEGFYHTDQTLSFGYGQRPASCQEAVYVLPLYLLSPSDSEGRHRAVRYTFRFDLRSEATGVEEVKSEERKVKNDIYDLMGRRVQNPTKGIYIINGQKVMMK